MIERNGGWTQTYRGKQFWPLDPRSTEIDPIDIAHSLSNQARYNGHAIFFYSVAEHCIHLAKAATPENRLAGLLHDAGEAYFSDIPRPIKSGLTRVKRIEAMLDRAICAKFIPLMLDPWPEEIKHLDNCIIHNEAPVLMRKPPADWEIPGEAIPGVKIQGWSPDRAKSNYLDMLCDLGGTEYRTVVLSKLISFGDLVRFSIRTKQIPWGLRG